MIYLSYLKDFLKAAVLFIVYSLGRKQAQETIEAHVTKKALDDATELLQKREAIRGRYDRIKSTIPDDWVELRKAGKN